MLVSILKLAREGEGASEACDFKFDKLEDVDLFSPVLVKLQIYNVSDSEVFHVNGQIQAKLNRVCDRCLKAFSQTLKTDLIADFADRPDDEQWPITGNNIDLSGPVREAILLNLPVKSLCRQDCSGII